MNCPQCDYGKSKTLETRKSKVHTRRRRQCDSCGWRFTTREVPDSGLKHLSALAKELSHALAPSGR
jgi:transcriptional regulator NrdR family protein